MTTAYVLKGHVNADGTVVCDETAPLPPGPVELTIKPLADASTAKLESVLEFLRRIPPGTRTKEDIDKQIQEERDSWGDR